jgi:hypothetical protein
MANWIKQVTDVSTGTTVSISDKAAIMIQQDGKFVGCMTARQFTSLVNCDRSTLGEVLEHLVAMGEDYAKNKESRKLEAQIAKLTAQNDALKTKQANLGIVVVKKTA